MAQAGIEPRICRSRDGDVLNCPMPSSNNVRYLLRLPDETYLRWGVTEPLSSVQTWFRICCCSPPPPSSPTHLTAARFSSTAIFFTALVSVLIGCGDELGMLLSLSQRQVTVFCGGTSVHLSAGLAFPFGWTVRYR